jgi:D-alanyl-D-alanine carboxypeptidase
MKVTHCLRCFVIMPVIVALSVQIFLAGCKKEDNSSIDHYTARIDHLTDSLVTTLVFHGKPLPLPGLIVGVWAPGQNYTYFKAKGYSNLATKRHMEVTDLFRVASITKTFTATLLLQLVDKGLIALDDKLDKYITGIPNGNLITIRHLLAMQSGLFEVNNDSITMSIFESNPDHVFSQLELIEAIKRHPPTFNPGERTEYCNSNFILAGVIIEILTGQSIENALKTAITQPISLTNTSFVNSRWMPAGKPYSSGYILDDNLNYSDATERFNMSVAFTAGAIVSNMDDLKKWVFKLTTGYFISPALQSQILIFNPIFQDMDYGLGIMRFRDNYMGHAGDGMGYHSFIARNNEKDITIAIFFNGDYPYPMHVFHSILEILK